MPLAAVRLAADYLMFDELPVDLYELPPWLADEFRQVMQIYYANRKTD